MFGSLSLSWLAGALSTLSPCVLPLLPILVLAAARQHRFGPLALAAGLIVSFSGAGTLLATAGLAFGVSQAAVRDLGAILLVIVGGILLVPRFQLAVAGAMAPLSASANGMLERSSFDGPGGQFLLGSLLGIVWSPCTGPTLGAAVGMAAQNRNVDQAALVMLFFGAGAATPILALAYGSRQAIAARRDSFAHMAKLARPFAAVLLIAMGIIVWSGIDHRFEAWLTEAMPAWLTQLTTRY